MESLQFQDCSMAFSRFASDEKRAFPPVQSILCSLIFLAREMIIRMTISLAEIDSEHIIVCTCQSSIP